MEKKRLVLKRMTICPICNSPNISTDGNLYFCDDCGWVGLDYPVAFVEEFFTDSETERLESFFKLKRKKLNEKHAEKEV